MGADAWVVGARSAHAHRVRLLSQRRGAVGASSSAAVTATWHGIWSHGCRRGRNGRLILCGRGSWLLVVGERRKKPEIYDDRVGERERDGSVTIRPVCASAIRRDRVGQIRRR